MVLIPAHNGHVSDLVVVEDEVNHKPSLTKRFWTYINSKKHSDVKMPPLKHNVNITE